MNTKFAAAVAFTLITASAVFAREEYPPRWHHELLHKAGEPQLTDARGNVEEYRLVYSGSFEYPLMIRATKIGDLFTLRAVHLGGDRIHREKRVTLSKKEWHRITLLVGKAGLWRMPPDDSDENMDGTIWLIESRKEGVYRAVWRYSPSAETKRRNLAPFLLLGQYMARLSGIGVTPH